MARVSHAALAATAAATVAAKTIVTAAALNTAKKLSERESRRRRNSSVCWFKFGAFFFSCFVCVQRFLKNAFEKVRAGSNNIQEFAAMLWLLYVKFKSRDKHTRLALRCPKVSPISSSKSKTIVAKNLIKIQAREN